MKTKFLIFSLLATFAMTNVFATEGNSEKQVAEEIHQQKVDQKVTPKSSNYIIVIGNFVSSKIGKVKST